MNIMLYIGFGIIRGRSWNVLPADTVAYLYSDIEDDEVVGGADGNCLPSATSVYMVWLAKLNLIGDRVK
jgi:hypothetical protein